MSGQRTGRPTAVTIPPLRHNKGPTIDLPQTTTYAWQRRSVRGRLGEVDIIPLDFSSMRNRVWFRLRCFGCVRQNGVAATALLPPLRVCMYVVFSASELFLCRIAHGFCLFPPHQHQIIQTSVNYITAAWRMRAKLWDTTNLDSGIKADVSTC